MHKFSYLLMLFIFTSCNTYYYYPTFQYIPTNTKGNEIQGAYFTDASNEGFLVSYSFNKNFGTFMNVNTFNNYDFSEGAHLSDLGLFYFKNIDIPNSDNIKMIMSLSSAYGYGENNRYQKFYDLGINRVFLQPSFSFTSRFLDLGISYRFSYVNYNLDVNGSKIDESDYSDLLDVGKSPFYFGEPHVFIGLGYKWVKLNYHFISIEKFNKSKISYIEDTGYLSLSIKYDLDKIFNK